MFDNADKGFLYKETVYKVKKNEKIINKPELLAPAGDLERLKIALMYGADAVYIGGSMFGLRANATNFTIEEIKEATAFAHNLGKKFMLPLILFYTIKKLNNYYRI